MSESETVRRRYPEPGNSGTQIRWSRSEPLVSKSDNATSLIRKSEDAFLIQYAVPFSVWFLQVSTHILLTLAKVAASLLALLLVTCLLSAIVPYTGLPTIADNLPKTTELGKYLLRMVQNFSMGNVKKRHRLRVYQF